MKPATIRVNILKYDEKERRFSSTPFYARRLDQDQDGGCPDERKLSPDEAEELGVYPSAAWMEDYNGWNNFQTKWMNDSFSFIVDADGPACLMKGHPSFSSMRELSDFNEKGKDLVESLRNELAEKDLVEVEDYQPLYSSVEVGDAVAGWWHIRDKIYGCVVPIQALPISDELKSRLMLWRKCRDENWLDEDCRRRFNEEGHDLEEHILWELNVGFDESVPRKKPQESKILPSCDSVESLGNRIRKLDHVAAK